MKILQVNCTWNQGSTGKITYDLHTGLLRAGHESLVCYGRGSALEEPGVTRLCPDLYGKLNNLRSRFTGMMYGGCYFSTGRLLRLIEKEKPDVVHLQCVNGYFVNIYRLVAWLKERGIRTVLTLHAEFMYTANCGHALDCDGWLHGCGNCPRLRQETLSLFFDNTARSFRKMRDAFAGFGDRLTVVSVSGWLMERASRSPILAGMDHRVIHNGVDTEIFAPTPREEARNSLGLPQTGLLFHATAMFSDQPGHLKGGSYVIELAKRLPEVTVVVAGRSALSGPLPENLHYLGQIDDQRILAQYYSAADVTVIASRKETFSMICAESLCCGTPVVGFEAGAPEQISLPQYSEFVPYGNMDALEQAVRRRLDRAPEVRIFEDARRAYSNATMFQNYLKLYQELTQ